MSVLKHGCSKNKKKVNSNATNTNKAIRLYEDISNSYKLQEPSVQLLFLGIYFGSKGRHTEYRKAEAVPTLCVETKKTLTVGYEKFLGLLYG